MSPKFVLKSKEKKHEFWQLFPLVPGTAFFLLLKQPKNNTGRPAIGFSSFSVSGILKVLSHNFMALDRSGDPQLQRAY